MTVQGRSLLWQGCLGLAVLVISTHLVGFFGPPNAQSEGPTEAQAKTSSDKVDLAQRPMPRIRPGTPVVKGPPDGWSHLILKSRAKVSSGDVDEVPVLVVQLSSFLATTFLADVESAGLDRQERFTLRTVAVGLASQIDGEDIIVDSDTHESLGANFDIVQSTALSQSEAQLGRIVQLARSPTVILFDAPGNMLRDDRHRPIVMRYAVIVDPDSGRLSTFAWLLDVTEDGLYVLVDDTLRRLPENLVQNSPLHVDADEFIAGIPTPTAFAIDGLPPGDELDFPPSLPSIIARQQLSAEMVVEIERQLSELANGASTERGPEK